ncbi:UNVERIFIED_CONTAM: hypothetical protein Slati_2989800 [Sesamum latifolium]|uniref:Uncharacterized protein n=1 Tax=Sesamum latifolium TaxID=2727402 RepID=A0AAW2VGN4_9LAMI
MRCILRILEAYEKAMGQKVNVQKSSVVFSPNTLDSLKQEIATEMGVNLKTKHEKYLALPSVIGKKKKEETGRRIGFSEPRELQLCHVSQTSMAHPIGKPSQLSPKGQESARWRISNGTECKVWSDPWYPRPFSFKVLSPPQILDHDATASIMEPLRRLLHLAIGNSFGHLRSPNKVKVFAWKCCRNALATASNIRSRIRNSDTIPCSSCSHTDEDIMHVLKHCPFSRQVWALSGIPFEFTKHNLDNPEEWLRSVSGKLTTSELGKFLVLCWSLWNARNKKYMEGLCYPPHHVAVMGISFHASFEEYNMNLQPKNPQRRNSTWRAPPSDTININYDGALFMKKGYYAIDVAARNQYGQCIAWTSKIFHGRVPAEIAEATALLEGMQLARSHGWNSICLEGDYALTSKLLSDQPDLSPLDL